ncbi:MAG: hypothetical protein ACHQAY_27180 [Hyphomicrobiales bacterium]
MSNQPANNTRKAAGGLRNIATLRTLANGAKPRQRHQIANRFARLENERARLERELGMWDNCRHATAIKLAKVNEEIAELRPALFEAPGTNAVLRQGHGQRRTPAETQVAGSTAPHKRAMTLEY